MRAGAAFVLVIFGALSHPAAAAGTPTPSEMADLGRQLFFDESLSASGRQSCASCHNPQHAYGPPNARSVQLGGARLQTPGLRTVPSLRYTLARTPRWFKEYQANEVERLIETDSVPTGGFGWDGRFDTLREQARFPLLAANEMGNANVAAVAAKLRRALYADRLHRLAGDNAMANDGALLRFALAALERFELDDPSFAPYTSKFDRYLDGKSALSAPERRGLDLFNDPRRGNCASCHLSGKGADGSHPLFTDFGFQALGVPRNPEIPANQDPRHFDMGLCGPLRSDQPNLRYCGFFKTPTLRNVAARGALFHNGRFHDMHEALRFYVQRDVDATRWYPRIQGRLQIYDDLPESLRVNVDLIDSPLDRKPGQQPAWSEADIDDVAAFLRTLTDEDVRAVASRARH
ncbi:MAG: ccpA [Hydrocarboniphaga sp.]|uniref:cytochrome-c peroxidase n=1 Tax=Hydrocarboniphaga sp. TaxID=2033016 RepID=UPI00262799A6|nr:cytochrome c peroxidase [Hydrocarboniphaga sp.]MDB5971196.1 ccpA [Hydrocarboniphaga sp.]